MADPLSILSLGSTLIGGVFSFVGGQQQAAAQKDAANFQAQVARNNQIIAQQNATYARQAGAAEAQTQGLRTAAVVGAEEAAQGSSGIDLTTGSPREVRRSTTELGQLDAANITQNAELRARGAEVQASNFGASAQLYSQQALNASSAGTFSGFGSLLSAGSQFSDKWLKFQNEGVAGFGGARGDWSPRGG